MKNLFNKSNLLATTLLASMAAGAGAPAAIAQEAAASKAEEIVVTGTRIRTPGVASSSPIATVGAEEIKLQQQSQAERILRILPISVPGDGENTNNGTAGAATVNLRGLGSQRNLVLIDGKRATPYNVDGRVDVSQIPTAMIERVDIVTGGASATYGSDAISGAVNFILKRNFEGVELSGKFGRTGDIDGKTYDAALVMGSNVAEGRGNVTMALSYAKREGVQFGDRDYGRVGVSSGSGAGLGITGAAQPANCGGTNTVPTTFGGSGTTVPARILMPAYDPDGTGPLAAVAGNRQFREDGTLGANCNQFNFNPYNYYQTPSERFSGVANGYFEITPNIEAYSRIQFSSTNVRQQIAPSGLFNLQVNVPINNPFLTAQARQTILDQFNGARLAGNVLNQPGQTVNWIDGNSNNVVDAGDTVRFAVARRTTEFGERSTTYDNNGFQMMFGVRGEIVDDWNYDVAFSHGEVDRTNISAGYVSNVRAAVAVNTISSTACTTAAGVTTAGCVPLNLFGKEGSITPAMAGYSSVTALEQQNYRQTYGTASVSGPINGFKSPLASAPLSVALGGEYREEFGSTTPDDCLRTPAATGGCLGGGGGDALPIVGGFSVREYFGEAILPLISDKTLAHSMNLELGYRYGDYDPSGINRTWKAGLNWAVTEDFRVRLMAQRAARAPNVGELFAPQRTGLANATSDPCSNANATALAANATLRTRCLSTGMSAAQVGTVTDIIAGQVNVFVGTNQNLRPAPEIADTRTYGFVWRPSFLPVLKSPTISVDYYSIDIDDYIGTLAAQQVLDGCYVGGDTGLCNLITRSGGTLVFAGSGIATYNTNLLNVKAEGIDLGVNFGLDLPENFGSMSFAYNATFASALEFQASTGIARVDCLGFYGNACDPLTSGNPAPEYKHVARATWEIGGLTTSALWRRIGETAVLPGQRSATFAQFRETKAFDYFDFTGSYTLNKNFEITAAVINAFNTDPPILGGDIGPTSSNGGNTFPQVYDTVGAVWSLGGRVKF